MRETPPYSLVEIRLLLSQYLDGTMEAEQMLALDSLLQQFPAYQEEFLKLQATQGLIQRRFGQQAEAGLEPAPEMGLLWQSIASQLGQDKQKDPESFEPEWVSAYVDGEIARDDAQREAFESQLTRNPEATKLLAELSQLSEMVRQFGYRQENACSLDLTAQVMAAFQAEQAVGAGSLTTLDEKQPLNVEWELLSAFADQALSPRDTIVASQLIESSETARTNLHKLNQLSEQVQRVGQQVQSQAPDVWPALHVALKADNVVHLAQHRQGRNLQWLRKAAVPIAVTVLLAFLSLPSLHIKSFTPPVSEAVSSAKAVQANTLKAEEAQPAQSQELASLPVSIRNERPAAEFASTPEAADMAPVVDEVATQASSTAIPDARSKSVSLKPMLEAGPAMAAGVSAESSPKVSSVDEVSPHRSPSSEAYLFDSLNKQNSDEDISNILGK